jgi:hypothetical protein
MTRLQIPLPTKDGDRNWAGLLKKLREKLDTQKANHPSDDWLFFEKAYSFLQSFKNPLRNNGTIPCTLMLFMIRSAPEPYMMP